MNKKISILSTALLLFSSVAVAQYPADGYYRIQNQKTHRYIVMNDNHGSIDYTAGDADFGALATWHTFDRVASYPGSIIYVNNVHTNYFNLSCQGTSTQQIVDHNIQLKPVGDGSYVAYASISQFTKYLSDGGAEKSRRTNELLDGYFSTSLTDLSNPLTHWIPLPINTSDNYMGLAPQKIGNEYWASFYAIFPYNFASDGMSAWYVTKVDKQYGMVVIEPVRGDVPGAAPVLVKCSKEGAVNNKLNLLPPATGNIVGNLLKGVYFCNDALASSGHRNVLAYDRRTMRVLGAMADGSLGFVSPADLQYIPYNSCYLTVDTDCPAELKVVTKEEYEAFFVRLTVKATSVTRVYGEANPAFEFTSAGGTLEGTPELSCDATATSPVGEYPIKVTKGSISNSNVTYEDGVLTILPAPLKVTALDAQRYTGDPNPTFELKYEGFKNNETEAVLTTKPTATTTATADSPAGEYPITVSGGEAKNYTLSYVNGKLTVIQKIIISVTAKNLTRVYGEANPTLEFTAEGGTLEGTPELSCDATATSPVGEYVIKVSKGSVTSPNVTYTNAKLTITPAPLKVTALDATREEGEANPDFELKYEGFKNNETDTVFTTKPTATTTATADSPAGEYEITVSGGEAKNYTLSYVNGKLTVTAKPEPQPTIIETTPEQQQENATPATYQVEENDEVTYIAPVPAAEGQEPVQEVVIPGTITVTNEAGEESSYTVTAIAEGAFENNENLRQVTIPETVEEIGSNAFAGCSSLEEIHVYSEEPIALPVAAASRTTDALDEGEPAAEVAASSVFAGVNYDTCKLYVPYGTKDKYAAAPGWGMFKNIIEMPDPSGINEILAGIERGTSAVYTISGQRVGKAQLKKGLYIVNGRKVVIK